MEDLQVRGYCMSKTHLSFYLKANRIHIFVDALRLIGSPANICFMIGENGKTLILKPYPKKDFHSHRVSAEVYKGKRSMEISSLRLCRSCRKGAVEYQLLLPGAGSYHAPAADMCFLSRSGGANQARVKSCTTISCDTAPHAAITITPSEACNNTSFHSTIFC